MEIKLKVQRFKVNRLSLHWPQSETLQQMHNGGKQDEYKHSEAWVPSQVLVFQKAARNFSMWYRWSLNMYQRFQQKGPIVYLNKISASYFPVHLLIIYFLHVQFKIKMILKSNYKLQQSSPHYIKHWLKKLGTREIVQYEIFAMYSVDLSSISRTHVNS